MGLGRAVWLLALLGLVFTLADARTAKKQGVGRALSQQPPITANEAATLETLRVAINQELRSLRDEVGRDGLWLLSAYILLACRGLTSARVFPSAKACIKYI